MSKIEMTTLKSGLRVITDSVPDVQSVALGIWVNAGTRDEDLTYNGTAHMLEHMLFKGTGKRNAAQIASEIEDVGGRVNAYTSREMTSYHIHLMAEHAGFALEILSDMYLNSTMPEEEIVRERSVVLQEIGMCMDTPDDLIFDHYYEAAYPGQGLGAPILGKADIIAAIPRAALEDFIRNSYTPELTVISAAGNIQHGAFAAQAEKMFGEMESRPSKDKNVAAYQGGAHTEEKELEQSHVMIGFEGLSRVDQDYYSAQALSTLLGGGMSSRLFQEVREKHGLVYSIFSFHSGYHDSGQFAIYAGTGPEKLDRLVPIICEEIRKVMQSVSDEELERTRAQLKSNIILGRESMMNRADLQAKHLFYHDRVIDPHRMLARIDDITHDSLQSVAKRIFSTRPTLAALGPLTGLEDYDKVVERLR